jgi:arsenate reductase (glutaredoxin)
VGPPREKDEREKDEPDEPREYSSPPCFLHEFEQQESAAAAVTIYHNPSCSKSRETLALIKASGVAPRIVEYLKTPPSEAELADVVRKLNMAPAELVRTSEAVFREKYQGRHLSDAQWIAALVADPILLQRPIVVRGDAAVIGRPPENAKRLL